jgi:Flp pilus assembly protein TadB
MVLVGLKRVVGKKAESSFWITLTKEDNGAAPALGAWRTRLDKKRKDRQSNRRVQKSLKEPRGMLQRLESLEMDVQELLERLRDPLAGFDGEGAFVGTGRRQQEGMFFFLSFFFLVFLFFCLVLCSFPLFLSAYIISYSFS